MTLDKKCCFWKRQSVLKYNFFDDFIIFIPLSTYAHIRYSFHYFKQSGLVKIFCLYQTSTENRSWYFQNFQITFINVVSYTERHSLILFPWTYSHYIRMFIIICILLFFSYYFKVLITCIRITIFINIILSKRDK